MNRLLAFIALLALCLLPPACRESDGVRGLDSAIEAGVNMISLTGESRSAHLVVGSGDDVGCFEHARTRFERTCVVVKEAGRSVSIRLETDGSGVRVTAAQ